MIYDLAIIGGGIVGLATAMTLSRTTNASILLLEAEDRLAAHQTGNNSGVIHSGLYYKPGSLKAHNCVEGREALYRFCEEHGIAHERCGKIVVATSEREIPALEELERRGKANGLAGMRRLRKEEIREFEPHANGIDGLSVPETGIVDYVQVCEVYAAQARANGATIELSARMNNCQRKGGALVIETTKGAYECRNLINCGGLQCDRIARMCGVDPGLKIVPFRGEYYELKQQKEYLVRNLIYPVPDPAFPFLGVHFTRMIHGGIEAGPNAVLAFRREGYTRSSFSLRDTLETFTYGGFWKMARKHWRMAMGEFHRSFSTPAFVKALNKLMPELGIADVKRGGAGVRAQALEKDGRLTDDFRIVEAPQMIHVLNAPSPAATASLSIGRTIAELAVKSFNLRPKTDLD